MVKHFIKKFLGIFILTLLFSSFSVLAASLTTQGVWHYELHTQAVSKPLDTFLANPEDTRVLFLEYADAPMAQEFETLSSMTGFSKVIFSMKKPVPPFLFESFEKLFSLWQKKKIAFELRIVGLTPVDDEVPFFQNLCQSGAVLNFYLAYVPTEEEQAVFQKFSSCLHFSFGLGRYPKFEETKPISNLPSNDFIDFYADHFPIFEQVDNLNITKREIGLHISQLPYNAQSLDLIFSLKKLSRLDLEIQAYPEPSHYSFYQDIVLRAAKQDSKVPVSILWSLYTLGATDLENLAKIHADQIAIPIEAIEKPNRNLRTLAKKVVFLYGFRMNTRIQ